MRYKKAHGSRPEGEHWRDIDNLAAIALRDKVFRRCLRHEEYALDIQVHDIVPVLFAELESIFAANQSGVIHRDINMTKLRYRAIQQCWNTINLSQIGGQA